MAIRAITASILDERGNGAIDPAIVKQRIGALQESAARALEAFELDHAADLYGSAFALASTGDEPALAAKSLVGLGLVEMFDGEVSAAEALWTRALETASPDLEQVTKLRLGFAHYERGDLRSAGAAFAREEREAATPALRGRAAGYLGNIARSLGRDKEAATLYGRAVRALREAGDTSYAAVFTMDHAVLDLLAGRDASAFAKLDELLRDDVDASRTNHLRALVAHYHVFARAKLGLPTTDLDDGPDTAPMRFLARTRALIVDSRSDPDPETLLELSATAPTSAHSRIAIDLLRRRAVVRESATRGLVVARDQSFFKCGDHEPVFLAQRPALQRLLGGLVDARLRAPGVFVDPGALAEVTWPGERILPQALKNRLHVGIATLRKLGLGAMIERGSSGYRIDRDARVLVV